jgi:hypothetical protein
MYAKVFCKARGPPLWEACDEAKPKDYFDDGIDVDVGRPDEDVDQSVNW